MQKRLQILGFVLVALVAGAIGSTAQTVVFQKLKLFATSSAADSIRSTGGYTAGSGAVPIIGTTGKIPALTSTYFTSVDGSPLTGLNASNLGSGTVPLARLAGITVSQMASAAISQFSNDAAYVTASIINSLDASNLSSGTVPSARLGTLITSNTTQSTGSYTATADAILIIHCGASAVGNVSVGGGARVAECNGNGVSDQTAAMFLRKGESYTLGGTTTDFYIAYFGS